jgi:hypothetical protein
MPRDFAVQTRSRGQVLVRGAGGWSTVGDRRLRVFVVIPCGKHPLDGQVVETVRAACTALESAGVVNGFD